MPPRWRRYLRFFGPNPDADVDDELTFHLEMRMRDYESRGLSHEAAMTAARGRFGDIDSVGAELRDHDRHQARAQRRRDLVEDLLQDARYALRSLRRAPAFTAVAVCTLALGIGANTAVFSVVDAVVIRALPYPHPEQLVSLDGSTFAEFTRVRQLGRSYADVGAYSASSVGLAGGGDDGGEPERVAAVSVSVSLLSVLGVPAALGRTFGAEEDGRARSNVVVIGNAIWTQRFGRSRDAVGRTVMIDGAPFVVIGVMPADFHFPNEQTALWLPIVTPPTGSGAFWGSGGYKLVGRLRPNVTAAAAQHELRALYPRIRHENPIWDPGPNYYAQAAVLPLQRAIVGSARTLLLLLLGVVTIVLLIACANVANLLLVRGASRLREISIRVALGGGRWRLIRQLLTESIVLALAGGTAGVGVAWVGLLALRSALPADLPRSVGIALDGRVLLVAFGVSLATGVIFGALPALRVSGAAIDAPMRHGGRASAGAAHRRLARLVVGGEIALALVLLIAAQLLVRSVWALNHIDPGFRTTSIVAATVSLPAAAYSDSTVPEFYDVLLSRLRSLPGVQSAGAVDRLPMRVGWGGALRIEGQFDDVKRSVPTTDHWQTISPGYLATIEIPLIDGRDFSRDDRAASPPVCLVSESFARHFWPGQSAIGKRVGYPWASPWITIVGVVRDAKLDSLTGTSEQTFYRPLAQAPRTEMTLAIRTTANEQALAPSIRQIVAQLDHAVPVSDVQTMSQVVDASAARPRFTMVLLALFAALAVTLGVIGIYGVMSYTVAQRTREMGVRMALGATPGDAMRLVLGEGLALAAAGIGVGMVAAIGSSRLLRGVLVGVTPTDPLTFVTVPIALALVALLASYLPARRATRVDPTTALRSE